MNADGLNVLIVDDEPLAVERLQILCRKTKAVATITSASDGQSALEQIEALRPDVVLLDVAMPGLDGIDVARAVEACAHRPAVIFCTAFDQFAIAAFEVAAIDFLLKPVTPDRLARALARVQRRRRDDQHGHAARSQWLDEVWIPHRSEMIRIAANSVDRIEAERDYMRLHIGKRSFLIHQTISALEGALDPRVFIRIHRSTIVRRDQIERFGHNGLGVWTVTLLDGTEVRIGRSYLAAARAMTHG